MSDLTEIDIYSELESIRHLLTRAVYYLAPLSPSYEFPLEMYADFDWSLIDAVPMTHDDYGYPEIVHWCGYLWTRDSHVDRDNPNHRYVRYGRLSGNRECRLVTFRETRNVPGLMFDPPGHDERKKGMFDDALAAMDEASFDTAVSRAFARFGGDSESAGSARLAICMNMRYASELNKAYIAGIETYIKRRDEMKTAPAARAHQEAKIAGHRAFSRVREQIEGEGNGNH